MIDRSPADRKVLCFEHFVRVLLVLGVPASQLGFPTEVAALPLSGSFFARPAVPTGKSYTPLLSDGLKRASEGAGIIARLMGALN